MFRLYRRLALIALSLACCSAPGATLRKLSLDEMTQSATAIVHARVVGASASFTGSMIYTHYKLQIIDTWKGFATTEVMLPGGVATGFRQSVPGVPSLQVGAEYVMFLWTSSSTGIIHLLGLTQGLYNISKSPDGSMIAARDETGETMHDASGAAVKDQAVRMSLSDMKTMVTR